MTSMNENDVEELKSLSEDDVRGFIRLSQESKFGVLDSEFLSQSISVLIRDKPVCVPESKPLGEVVELFGKHGIGSVLAVDQHGKLTGIFTERDFILKGLKGYPDNAKDPVSTFMTQDPVSQLPDVSVAFVLNLMSHGGFRHMPLVDEENIPIGIVSIRDLTDYLVESFTSDLLNFKTVL
jgi:CBS domain-containing protein